MAPPAVPAAAQRAPLRQTSASEFVEVPRPKQKTFILGEEAAAQRRAEAIKHGAQLQRADSEDFDPPPPPPGADDDDDDAADPQPPPARRAKPPVTYENLPQRRQQTYVSLGPEGITPLPEPAAPRLQASANLTAANLASLPVAKRNAAPAQYGSVSQSMSLQYAALSAKEQLTPTRK